MLKKKLSMLKPNFEKADGLGISWSPFLIPVQHESDDFDFWLHTDTYLFDNFCYFQKQKVCAHVLLGNLEYTKHGTDGVNV